MTGNQSPQLVLAVDSAGLACSAAVALGGTVLSDERVYGMHGQAETLLPLIDRTMRRAGQSPGALGLVVVTVGPGSFTGIRAGIAAASGIALATGARLIGVTSFEAVAVGARKECAERCFLLIALESRREDLYVQFLDMRSDPLGEPSAIMPIGLRAAVDAAIGTMPLLIAGDAAQRAGVAIGQRPKTAILEYSASGAIGALRAGIRLLQADAPSGAPRPLYLRPPDVTLPGGSRKPSGARA
jgi:tRNA threonylcarbamoyladenosine biosynthesis protein TsaB